MLALAVIRSRRDRCVRMRRIFRLELNTVVRRFEHL